MRTALRLVAALAVAGALSCNRPSRGAGAPPPAIHPDLWPAVPPAVARDPAVEDSVERLLAGMSVEEKVGQVIQAEIGEVTPADVRRYRLGSILNGGGSHPGGKRGASAAEWVALADAFYDASVDTSAGGRPIPTIWGCDAVHGHNNVTGATIFPHNIGLGATRDAELVRRVGEVTAVEMRVTGLDWDFAPTVAVVRDPRWGRTYEGFSEDADVVRRCAAAMVRGLQGDPGTASFLDGRHVIATAKHFLGDGGTRDGRDRGDNTASEAVLRDVHAAGYVAALEAGVQTVMASFSSWHGGKMHGSRALLTDVLKGRLGLDGLLVGDWDAHAELPGCTSGSCPDAINAGVDVFMAPVKWRVLLEHTLAQARSGAIPAARLDDAVRRILRVKVRAGVLAAGRPSQRPLAGRAELLGSGEHREVARRAVRESLVLLKNDGRILPLRRGVRVLVAGDAADEIARQCGGWTISWLGDGNRNADFPGGSSIWDGVREAVRSGGGTAVLSPNGRFDVRPDVAIAVIGETPYAETEGDRATLEFRAGRNGDARLLRRLKAAGVPVVTVFLSGRPMWTNRELNASDAFVAAWLPGSEGRAVADLLFRAADGTVAFDFAGKLPYSWPRAARPRPAGAGGAVFEPLFPFGFGLTVADDRPLLPLPEDPAASAPAPSDARAEGGSR